jgi:hypothetical protein
MSWGSALGGLASAGATAYAASQQPKQTTVFVPQAAAEEDVGKWLAKNKTLLLIGGGGFVLLIVLLSVLRK